MRGVLVGGTNGKGSTCAFLVSILAAAGYRVGSMPKPHLQSYTERICVNAVPISEADFAALVTDIVPAVERVTLAHGAPTEFEMLTAAALLHLSREGVELLVSEVGLGGRLDSTNVLDLGVKVITCVDLDHTQYLGPDIESIAREKAGIIRAGDALVTGALHQEAEAVVSVPGASASLHWRVGREVLLDARDAGWDGVGAGVRTPARNHLSLRSSLLGRYQADNLAVAVAAADAAMLRHGLDVPAEAVRAGVAAARWPGRLELFTVGGKRVLVDGGHNPAAVQAVTREVMDLAAGGAVRLVFAAMADKDHAAMLSLLPPGWPVHFTAVDDPRAAPPGLLLDEARGLGRTRDAAVAGVAAALDAALREVPDGGILLVLGSLYLAGEARLELAR
jgi:dihydrofolate synthase/folylpolyglutamate synthase